MSANFGLSLLTFTALRLLASCGGGAASQELERQRAMALDPPIAPATPTAQFQGPTEPRLAPDSGLALFLRNGCGACHAIRGTDARGTIAPDLSHVGSRTAIGAGVLPNTEEAIERFIARPDLVKPGVKMPAFDMLPRAEIQAIARYLKALQ
ncbi:MAG: c-type cytochrome [Mesorhizobium sp.]|uniref:c-type cytochrome n=1 Tax=Mesorhizobium sp. TaxID=1871066 RepID=UPI0011FFEDE1|nr:c-type cytochrome [Mesorhizobium sp.]TIQ36165.1 MAG: c-type cytochrome [Mesorhizobium sp.]